MNESEFLQLFRFADRTWLVDHNTEAKVRKTRNFGGQTQRRTQNCVDLLRRRTTEKKLLEAAGGNKWIVRRAIEMYKMNLDINHYQNHKVVEIGVVDPHFGFWSNNQ